MSRELTREETKLEVGAANEHTLETIAYDPDAPSSHMVIAECACHSPDGDGVGRADFHGSTVEEATEGWFDHMLAQARHASDKAT